MSLFLRSHPFSCLLILITSVQLLPLQLRSMPLQLRSMHATAVTEHTAPKDEASSSSSLAGIETLTIDNTQKIFEIMYDARKKWRSIGGIFNVSESTLDNIDAENKHNDDKLRSVIIEWLKRLGEPCTWSQVAMALRNKTVAREDLALQVFEKYPGMLSYKKNFFNFFISGARCTPLTGGGGDGGCYTPCSTRDTVPPPPSQAS